MTMASFLPWLYPISSIRLGLFGKLCISMTSYRNDSLLVSLPNILTATSTIPCFSISFGSFSLHLMTWAVPPLLETWLSASNKIVLSRSTCKYPGIEMATVLEGDMVTLWLRSRHWLNFQHIQSLQLSKQPHKRCHCFWLGDYLYLQSASDSCC